MSLADLKEKIIADAETEAREILNEAAVESEAIIEKANMELEKLRGQVEKDARRLSDERYQNIVTLAKVDGRNREVAKKREMVDLAFDQALEKLRTSSGEKRKALVKKLLLMHPPQGEVKVMTGSKDGKMIDQSFLDAINREIRSNGKFVLAEPDRQFENGIYLVTDDVEIDLTLEGVLRQVREDIEMEIIGILFEKG